MPRTCTICSHPDRRRIDALLVEQVPNRRISTQFDVSESAVRRHAASHLPKIAVEAATDERQYDHHRKLKILEKTLYSVLTRALKAEDDAMALRTHGSLLKHYGFVLQLGEIEDVKREIEELKEEIREREDMR